MADHESPDNEPTAENQAENAQPVPAENADGGDAAPTEMIGVTRTGPGSRERTVRRVLLVGGAVVLVAALAFGLTQFIRKDAPPAIEEVASAEVFLEPADAAGDSPFAPTSFTTQQPDPTQPGTDPLGPPPAAPAVSPDGQAAPMAMRTANGDLPGLYGGTLDTTTCDAELMFNYLDQNPNKANAWAGVHRIKPSQIRAWGTELTPVLLRTDTRVTDHGYIEVGQAIPRQAVLQAGTAVMVDKYGSPRVRCISGSPLLDPVAITAPVARPAGNVVVQPAAAVARPRVIYVGPRWPRFDPVTIVVIRRVTRIIEYFLLWDFRRGVLLARRIGILIRDIANLFDPRLARIVPANLLPRPAAARPPAPLPLQPPRAGPQAPPVQRLPAQVPPVQQAPAQGPAPAQVPAPQPPSGPPRINVYEPEPPIYQPDPPIFDPDPPIYQPDPPIYGPDPGMPGGHPEGLVPQQQMPGGSMPEHPVDDGTGVYVPKITDPCSNPAYPCLPQAPASGGGMPEHPQAVAPEPPASSGGHDTGAVYDPPAVEVPQDTGSGGYTEPDYGSLPGPSDTGGDPGGNLQCDALLNPC